jgi:pimeloyl-ACP methyl ester carboxylesterase
MNVFLRHFFAVPLLVGSLAGWCGQLVERTYPDGAANSLQASFVPDVFITEQVPEDLALLKKMKVLFFETDHTANPQRDVYRRAIQEHGGQEVVLFTHDQVRIAALYFKRQNAPINIIYVTGYFNDQTPTKEWCAPFAVLFPECNVLSFDWRGFGSSEGYSGLLHRNDFGSQAYPDIQAAIDFMRKENNRPIVLVGFCFGAAMVLQATIKAKQEGRALADALVLNCIFSRFQNQFNRAIVAEDRWLQRMVLSSGLGQRILEGMTNGSLFEVNPIDMIKQIAVPCYFEHYTYDPFAILGEGIDVYQTAVCPKMFMQSDIGRHVRIHGKVPYQYRQAFFMFLKRFGLVSPDFTVPAV